MTFTFKNFFNKVSNDSRIFTREDIANMSSKEFIKHEKAINYQMENLGLPTNNELKGRNDVVFVHKYMRSDGTTVKEHYRSKPDGEGGLLNNAQIKNGTSDKNFWNSPFNINGVDEYNLLKLGNKWYNTIRHDYPDAFKLFDIYLTKPQNILSNDEYKYLSPGTSYSLNKQFGLTGRRKMSDNWSGFAFSENSSLSKNISNSKELQDQIRESYNLKTNSFNSNNLSIAFKSNPNLRLSIANSTVLNPQIKNGYFTGVLFDKYDFAPNDKNLDSWLVHLNNLSALMGLDRRYYILAPIKFKW